MKNDRDGDLVHGDGGPKSSDRGRAVHKKRVLLELASAITSETPVLWDAEIDEHPELASGLRRLRLLEALARAHRGLEAPMGATALEDVLPLAAPAAGALTVLFTWGPLEVRELVGQGSSGEVYRALDRRLEREVALKLRFLDDDTRARRFLDEARRLARVRHVNVVAVHGAEIHGGRIGIWTDLVRGKTLEERLAQDGPLGAEEGALIGLDLCRALAAVHGAGLVHGDVKAANVMREEGGKTVLMDFSSSSVSDRQGDTAAGRGLTAAFGTPAAMAPELFRGKAASPASDLYALGVLLYRLVTGRYPVPGRSVAELAEKHGRGERVPLRDVRSDLPAAFVKVVERALDPDPAARYASAGAMEAALLAAMAAAPGASGALGTEVGLRLPRRSRQRWQPLAIAAALAVLLGIAAARLLQRGAVISGRDGERAAADTPPTAGTIEGAPIASAPIASAPPAGAPSAAAPLRVEAALHRVRGGVEQPLPSGSIIHPGENLFMTIEGEEAMHVYVLNEDAVGALFLLYPVAGIDLTNPLAAGVRHRLPGPRAGVAQDWQVTSAGGREWILAIATREPLAPLEQELARFAPADPGRPVDYAELRPQSLNALRGIGGMQDSRSADARAAASRLADLARQLAASGAEPGRMWVRLFELHNPGS